MSYSPDEFQEPYGTEADRVTPDVASASLPVRQWALVILKLDAVAVWLVD